MLWMARSHLLFLSTLSLRRATHTFAPLLHDFVISIHALLAESDCPLFLPCWLLAYFYPRSPCGERRIRSLGRRASKPFLSTLSLRRATAFCQPLLASVMQFLSTLSLRRATGRLAGYDAGNQNFYPRSPCGERRRIFSPLMTIPKFLSTLSLRRATTVGVIKVAVGQHFYPRSPCGERRVHYDNYNLHCVISIHALLAESDAANAVDQILPGHISIHALLAESDRHSSAANSSLSHFYPRSPCGERQDEEFFPSWFALFLSTLSLRRATKLVKADTSEHLISIHALLAESDYILVNTF